MLLSSLLKVTTKTQETDKEASHNHLPQTCKIYSKFRVIPGCPRARRASFLNSLQPILPLLSPLAHYLPVTQKLTKKGFEIMGGGGGEGAMLSPPRQGTLSIGPTNLHTCLRSRISSPIFTGGNYISKSLSVCSQVTQPVN